MIGLRSWAWAENPAYLIGMRTPLLAALLLLPPTAAVRSAEPPAEEEEQPARRQSTAPPDGREPAEEAAGDAEPSDEDRAAALEDFLGRTGEAEGPLGDAVRFLRGGGAEFAAVGWENGRPTAVLAELPAGDGTRVALLLDPEKGQASLLRYGDPHERHGLRRLVAVPLDAGFFQQSADDVAAGLRAYVAAEKPPEAAEAVSYHDHQDILAASTRLSDERAGPVESLLAPRVETAARAAYALGTAALGERREELAADVKSAAWEKAQETFDFSKPFIGRRAKSQMKQGISDGVDEVLSGERPDIAVRPALDALRCAADECRSRLGLSPLGGPAVPPLDRLRTGNAIVDEASENVLTWPLIRKD